jgi:hypothetical protein
MPCLQEENLGSPYIEPIIMRLLYRKYAWKTIEETRDERGAHDKGNWCQESIIVGVWIIVRHLSMLTAAAADDADDDV